MKFRYQRDKRLKLVSVTYVGMQVFTYGLFHEFIIQNRQARYPLRQLPMHSHF